MAAALCKEGAFIMLDLAIKNGISKATYKARLKFGWDEKKAATRPVKYEGDYAVYKKGELVVIGSRKECAEFLGVSEHYIYWMTTPTGIARRNKRKNPEMAMAAIRLDVEDDE